MPKKPPKKQIEQYEHSDKTRVNNPPVGLVDPKTDPDLDPQLQWAGKSEHTSLEVPTVSLHVHERIAVKIVDDRGIESLRVMGVT